MKLGKPNPRFFSIDPVAEVYGMHVVTFMATTGWKAIQETVVTPTVDAKGNCDVVLYLQKLTDHYSFLTPIVHTFQLAPVNWSATNKVIRVRLKVKGDDGNSYFLSGANGGGGSIHIEDADDGSLGGDDLSK